LHCPAKNAWYRDPLLLKECRTRLRARAVLIVELLYVCALCGVTLLTLLFGGRSRPSWEAGAALFSTLAYTQAMILLFVTPLVSASAVSGEKEQKTFDSLMVTPVSPRRMILAKLAAVLAVFVVLLAVSVPFAAVAYILGGVSLRALSVAWIYTLLLTGFMGALGLYWSTRFDRSIASIPAAAVCAVLVGVVMPIFCDSGPDVLKTASPTLFLGKLFTGGQVKWFGAHLPFCMFAFTLLAVTFGGVLSATIQRMRFAEERRYLTMRAFGLAAWILFVTGLLGELATGACDKPAEAREQVFKALMTLCVLLTILAPWIGSSLPVIRSGMTRASHPIRDAKERLATVLLTQPIGFMTLLIASGCLVVLAVWLTAGSLQLPWSTPLLTILGVVLSAQAWTLLSFRLADRRTLRGRFIGMSVAYVAATVLTIAPFVVFNIISGRTTDVPLWQQLVSLLSPMSAAELLGTSHTLAKSCMAGLNGLPGSGLGVWALTPAFYGVLLVILALPIYSSEAKRRRKARPPAEQ